MSVVASRMLICHCEARSNLSFCFARLGQSRSPRCARDDRKYVVKAPCGGREPAFFCHCEPAKQSLLFSFTFKTEIATLRLPSLLSLRACEAISLFVLPALNNRDRHAALATPTGGFDKNSHDASAMTIVGCCELRVDLSLRGTKQSLFF